MHLYGRNAIVCFEAFGISTAETVSPQLTSPTPEWPSYHTYLPIVLLPSTADPKRTPTTAPAHPTPCLYFHDESNSPNQASTARPWTGNSIQRNHPSHPKQPVGDRGSINCTIQPWLRTESNAFSVSNWEGIAVFTLARVDRELDPQSSSQPT